MRKNKEKKVKAKRVKEAKHVEHEPINPRSSARIVGIYGAMVLLFTFTMFRVYAVGISDSLVATAGAQGKYMLDVAATRGVIYDRDMESFVNKGYKYLASVMPTVEVANALLPLKDDEGGRESLLAKLSATTPFIMEVPSSDIYAKGLDIFKIPLRYGSDQLAPHLIGYLGGDMKSGVAGIEKAFDKFLTETGTNIKVSYQTDALGRVMNGVGMGVTRSGDEKPVGGVVLTLDSRIQKLTQNALSSGCEKGAAVVMDIFSGDILAMASIPSFDQNDISASFDSVDAPFINRAVSGYNIGSAFKIIVGTAALESGISASYTHYCPGYIDINGVIFRCNNNAIHGEVEMERAYRVSCNAYFISLAQEMNPEYLLSMTRNMGLGSATELASGLVTQTGNLPDAAELSNKASYANFSFGQGSSLATPLQMARVVATIANSGLSVTPRLVEGFTLDGYTLAEQTPVYTPNQIISEKTAKEMTELMTAVVDNGSGRTAKPLQGGAGGKTSSAQTGIEVDGVEIVHAWFAGFYPAAKPQYAIIIFVEGGESGERVAAPIFRQIADGINGLKYLDEMKRISLGYSATE